MKRLASTTFVDRNSSERKFSMINTTTNKNTFTTEDREEDFVLFKDLSIDRMVPFNLPYEHVFSATVTSGLKKEEKNASTTTTTISTTRATTTAATYKQRSKEEQLEIVLNFIKEHPTRERGSIMEYCTRQHHHHINKSQLSRYLKAYDAGQLTQSKSSTTTTTIHHTIERGHPSTLMNATQIEKVLQVIKNEQGDNEDISNKRIGDIIFEVIGKQPSSGYVSKFASTYLTLNGPKRKKKKLEAAAALVSVKSEHALLKREVKSETSV